MSIKTSRAQGTAIVEIDYEQCKVCGLCVKLCKGGPLYLDDHNIRVDQNRGFGCFACGQCVAACPTGAITVEGRDLFPSDLIALPAAEAKANYEQLKALMLARRSIREFQDKEVEPEVIDKIIEAATTAPMGIPPSDVELLVLQGKAKVQEFAGDFMALAEKSQWLFAPYMLWLWRLLLGKEMAEAFESFIGPLFKMLIEERKDGKDYLFYDAPLAVLFYSSSFSDPADAIISATYAVLAAEALGLGSCMIGSVAPLLKYGKKLKAKYGIPLKCQPGIMVVFGYPAVKYQKALKRRLAKVNKMGA
jgi:nitroreductase/ferredoxin